jgi:hypothetical protein
MTYSKPLCTVEWVRRTVDDGERSLHHCVGQEGEPRPSATLGTRDADIVESICWGGEVIKKKHARLGPKIMGNREREREELVL